jgi:hypothetical protein
MMKPIALTSVMLVAAAASAFAQSGNPPPASPAAGQRSVLGQTGTMYDGNNANLQLPPQPNTYWAQLWAQPGAGNSGAASAVGSGAAGASLGGTTGGGEH